MKNIVFSSKHSSVGNDLDEQLKVTYGNPKFWGWLSATTQEQKELYAECGYDVNGMIKTAKAMMNEKVNA